jgi:pyruvate/2-oxoglutarate/acetoin dehydrogenase E1 component
MRVVEDINGAIGRLMDADPDLYLIGEDINDPYGGAFKVTKGLSSKHPQRVLTTPISEAGLVGFSMGMSMRGKPVIAEIMFGDFLTLALDQLLNHAAKVKWMFDGAVEVPLIVRTPMGGGRGYGPTHSQSIEKHFCGIPGLTLFAVNQFQSPGALLERAYCLKSPVLFIENKVMYSKLVEGDRVKTYPSPDVVIITYGGVAEACVRAAERLGKQDEVIVNVVVIEQLSPIDAQAIYQGVGSAKRILTVEEGVEGWGFGAECARVLMQRGLRPDHFRSIAAEDIPIPNSKDWEARVLPNEHRIGMAVLELLTA